MYNLRCITVAFAYIHEKMVKKILVTLIRPRLEYAAALWVTQYKKYINKIERIQSVTAKLAPTLSELTYLERLSRLALPALEQRRERGNLLAIYMKNVEILGREDLLN